jgi:undecaprenyl-phosphate 4-deoxy-4-formamido-L-arabinose transferase
MHPRSSAATPNSISVVVPVYNAAETLPALIARLEPVLRSVATGFEAILVDDGSEDETAAALEALARRHEWIRPFTLMRNYGQHNALLCGIRAARHEVIVTLDDDLQNPPEEIPLLLRRLAEGYDVVYGTPVHQQHDPWRVAASQVTRFALQSVLGAQTARHVSAFRAFRAHVREAFAGYRSSFVSIDVLLTWGTTRFSAVPVRHEPRAAGTSHYTFRKLVVHSVNMMTGFSTLPLQIASLLGFAATFFGLCVLMFVIGRYLIQGSTVPGFPFLASLITLLSGTQLFAIGVIGEYLARMHFTMMERPPYAVRPALSHGQSERA